MNDPPAPRDAEKRVVDIAIRLGALGIFAFLVFSLVKPFAPLALWSGVLTVALYPIFGWLRVRLGGHGIAAAVTVTLLALALVIGPVAVLLTDLVDSLTRLAGALRNGTLSLPDLPENLASLTFNDRTLGEMWANGASEAHSLLEAHGHALVGPGETTLRVIAGLAGGVLLFAAAVIVAGFLFVPGPRIVGTVGTIASRIAGPRGGRFVELAGVTMRSVARGVIGVAIVQALLLGTVMFVAGVPHAGLLTLALLVLSIAQLGSLLVVLPVLVWIWVTKDTTFAIIFGVIFVPLSFVETALKPIALGKGLETPMVVILGGVIGGTIAFGLPGLFVGPVILAVFYELVLYWLADRHRAPGNG